MLSYDNDRITHYFLSGFSEFIVNVGRYDESPGFDPIFRRYT